MQYKDLRDLIAQLEAMGELKRIQPEIDESASIVVSQNLSAADALILSRNDVLGYLTEIGGITSHMALLARALRIPAVVGVRHVASMIHGEAILIVDGYSGTVVIHPEPQTIREFEAKRDRYHQFEADLAGLETSPPRRRTAGGLNCPPTSNSSKSWNISASKGPMASACTGRKRF